MRFLEILARLIQHLSKEFMRDNLVGHVCGGPYE